MAIVLGAAAVVVVMVGFVLTNDCATGNRQRGSKKKEITIDDDWTEMGKISMLDPFISDR